jgi:hypothetical protein
VTKQFAGIVRMAKKIVVAMAPNNIVRGVPTQSFGGAIPILDPTLRIDEVHRVIQLIQQYLVNLGILVGCFKFVSIVWHRVVLFGESAVLRWSQA